MTARPLALELPSDPGAAAVALGLALADNPQSLALVLDYVAEHCPGVVDAVSARNARAEASRAHKARTDARRERANAAYQAVLDQQRARRVRRLAGELGAALRRQLENPPPCPRLAADSAAWMVLTADGDVALGHGASPGEAWLGAVAGWFDSATNPDLWHREDPPSLAECAAEWRMVQVTGPVGVAGPLVEALSRIAW